ncbi:MAG: DGQHR domain-containing protein [Pedobacter sp.]
MTEDPQSIKFKVIKVQQPIGVFFIAALSYKILCDITHFDIRRIRHERDVETYLGIQRPLSPDRVDELHGYVNTNDACFPSGVILSVPGVCAELNAAGTEMTLRNYLTPPDEEAPIFYREIAKVLDGQHRIEGLKKYGGSDEFEVNVVIFVDIDLPQQAQIFSTVNLAQTKVNRSLVYDLLELSKSRSPQKTCHNIAVALDKSEGSPFYKKIKRLGVATAGRFDETITQATFVQGLLKYISLEPMKDRDMYLKGKLPLKSSEEESYKLIFRNMFIDQKDTDIANTVWNYFEAVQDRWPDAWKSNERGMMLNKTNGFNGLIRFLRNAYLKITNLGSVATKDQFSALFNNISCDSGYFNTTNFLPGSTGESELYKYLLRESGIRK